MTETEPDFGLYVHWPFCAAKCPYCDFNSHVWSSVDQDRWLAAFLVEIDRVARATPNHVLGSIFFGGGTPSLMPAATVEQIIDRARVSWRTTNDPEITLEANPTSSEASKFRDFRAAGVNRVSVGVQALEDNALKSLGRLHSVEEALKAVELSQRLFDRSSFDLIYARQHQSLSDWRSELASALERSAGHVSLYQLTIEEGTAFGDRFAKGRLGGLPDEDASADMYLLTQELCERAGLPAYEVSNHALSGHEARHNLIYWRAQDYAGIGPGAHGRLSIGAQRIATYAERDPREWLRRAEARDGSCEESTPLTDSEAQTEGIMMGLRLRAGLSLEQLENTDPVVDWNSLNLLIEGGFLEKSKGRLAVTDTGRPLLNSILKRLLV